MNEQHPQPHAAQQPSPLLVTLRTIAAMSGVPYDTLKKPGMRRRMPAPVDESFDTLGRRRTVRWERRKIEAWIERGMPRDVAAFERWYREH